MSLVGSPTPTATFGQIFRLYLWVLGAELGTLFVAALLDASKFTMLLLDMTVGSAVWLVRYQILAKRLGWASLRARFNAPGAKPLIVAFATVAALMLLLNAATALLKWFGVSIIIPSEPELTGELARVPILILVIGIIVPMAEELIFRGLIFDRLRQKRSPVAAAAITSLVFALGHNNHWLSGAVAWVEFFDRFVMGLLASWLVIRYNSLTPAFVLHATNNGLVVVASALGS